MTDFQDKFEKQFSRSLQVNKNIRLFRKRFVFRDDVWGRYWSSKNSMRSGYAPACENIFAADCGITARVKSPCTNCHLKKYRPVTDNVIAGHILGRHRIILYPLFPNGTMRVGACDLDCKPGKEGKGYTWEDVARLLELFREWKLPYAAARSSTFGFHIYFLFDEPYMASHFRAVILEAFEVVGFMEMLRLGKRPLPEVFPKQANPTNIGNGIRPPLVMPGFIKERNGFIDDSNIFIPPESQWDYLESISSATAADFDRVIEVRNLEVHDHVIIEHRSKHTEAILQRPTTVGGNDASNETSKYPLAKFDQVLGGCSALRRVAKIAKNEVVGHNDGLGLLSILCRFKGWRSWLQANMKGWDTTPAYQAEINQAVATYSPFTCRKLQEWGVCPHRDHLYCLPQQTDDTGKSVNPSPIRFATQRINWGDIARSIAEEE